MSAQEGRLYLNSSGRLETKWTDSDGFVNRDYWTSGEGIEVRLGGHWVRGRIEYSHTHEGYYFIPSDAPMDMLSQHQLVGLAAMRPQKARAS